MYKAKGLLFVSESACVIFFRDIKHLLSMLKIQPWLFFKQKGFEWTLILFDKSLEGLLTNDLIVHLFFTENFEHKLTFTLGTFDFIWNYCTCTCFYACYGSHAVSIEATMIKTQQKWKSWISLCEK